MRQESLPISTSFQVDATAGVPTLNVDSAPFPDQNGQQQKRFYKLDGDELRYRVQARPNGDVAVSVWPRLEWSTPMLGTGILGRAIILWVVSNPQ
jgi:hypothetical protein